MNVFESIRIALGAIWVNKMRSLLTMLGIIIGIASVITVVALGNGVESAMNKEFQSFGVGRIFIATSFEETVAERDMITRDDVDALRNAFKDEIKALQPSVSESGKVQLLSGKKKMTSITVQGARQDYREIQQVNVIKGRFILEDDVLSERPVAVIDSETANKIFGTDDVLGESLVVNLTSQNVNMTIVGVYKKESTFFSSMGQSNPVVYTPLSTAMKIFGYGDTVWFVEGAANLEYPPQETLKRAIELLERRHGNEGLKRYYSESMESQMDQVNGIMAGITAVIGAIAAVSLLVGGIGVMNIMLVSVTERTREIGIRKALGAKYGEIMSQFLIEAVIISFIGGVIGTALGIGLSTLIAAVVPFLPSAEAGFGAILLAWLFSAGVGVVFGIFPASKAAKLNPIDALRYE
mgnify:CR=1 FL=1